jgi:hypothetical protein
LLVGLVADAKIGWVADVLCPGGLESSEFGSAVDEQVTERADVAGDSDALDAHLHALPVVGELALVLELRGQLGDEYGASGDRMGVIEREDLSRVDEADIGTAEKVEGEQGEEIGEDELRGQIRGSSRRVLLRKAVVGVDRDVGRDAAHCAMLAVVDGDEDGDSKDGADERVVEARFVKRQELQEGRQKDELEKDAKRMKGTHDGSIETDDLQDGEL